MLKEPTGFEFLQKVLLWKMPVTRRLQKMAAIVQVIVKPDSASVCNCLSLLLPGKALI